MSTILEALRRFALSKGGVPLLIFLLCVGAFASGYNYYAIKDAFSQVQRNEIKIQKLNETVVENSRRIDHQQARDDEMKRLLTVIGCEVVEDQTARDLIECGSLDRRVDGTQ